MYKINGDEQNKSKLKTRSCFHILLKGCDELDTRLIKEGLSEPDHLDHSRLEAWLSFLCLDLPPIAVFCGELLAWITKGNEKQKLWQVV